MRSHDLETLLMAQLRLRRLHNDRLMEFETEKAIEEVNSGETNSHTQTILNWANSFLAGSAA